MKSYFAYSRSRKNSNKFLTFITECQKIITSLNCLVFLRSESDMLLFWMYYSNVIHTYSTSLVFY